MDGKEVVCFDNGMVDLHDFVDFEIDPDLIWEKVRFSVLKEILENFTEEADIKKELADRRDELIPRNIIKEDILASINYLNGLAYGIGTKDDIDHLGNRRLRCVGELLQNHRCV